MRATWSGLTVVARGLDDDDDGLASCRPAPGRLKVMDSATQAAGAAQPLSASRPKARRPLALRLVLRRLGPHPNPARPPSQGQAPLPARLGLNPRVGKLGANRPLPIRQPQCQIPPPRRRQIQQFAGESLLRTLQSADTARVKIELPRCPRIEAVATVEPSA